MLDILKNQNEVKSIYYKNYTDLITKNFLKTTKANKLSAKFQILLQNPSFFNIFNLQQYINIRLLIKNLNKTRLFCIIYPAFYTICASFKNRIFMFDNSTQSDYNYYSNNLEKTFMENNCIDLENALYIISTPIGNMSDITIRALKTISSLDYLFCEDTRITNKLLKYYKLDKKSLFIYNDFSKDHEREKIIKLLKNGKSVGLVSDAGTPLISDPGFKLVKECKDNNLKVIPICGASAILTCLVASGLPSDKFLFYGFLSEKENERKKEIEKLKYKEETIIIYESPKRILFTLNEILNIIGNIDICIGRELTKIYEDIKTDKLLNILEYYKNNTDKIKGEFVLIIKNNDINKNQDINLEKIKIIYNNLKDYMKPKEIADFIIKIGYHNDKKEVYNILLTM